MAERGSSERKADRSIPSVCGLAPTASAKPDFSSFNLRPYWDLSLPSGPAVCNLWTFCNCCPGRTEFAQINCLPGLPSIHYHPETYPRPSAQSPTRHNAYEQPHRLQRQRIQGCRLAPVCLRQKGSLGQKVRSPPSLCKNKEVWPWLTQLVKHGDTPVPSADSTASRASSPVLGLPALRLLDTAHTSTFSCRMTLITMTPLILRVITK